MQIYNKVLAVVGAGPKGIAVAVKAKVLSEFGFGCSKVILIEKNHVAANWTGDFGFTNGDLKLGTSPEKDLVFPATTDVHDKLTNQKIRSRLQDFSWTSFLSENYAYSEWIDRGRPAPSHRRWSEYLMWVASKLTPEIQIIKAEVTAVKIINSRWMLTTTAGEFGADRLMFTGPGKDRYAPTDIPGAYGLESFWSSYQKGEFEKSLSVAVVGAGENAASIILALQRRGLDIDVIVPRGFLCTRAENYEENRFYSNPVESGWNRLSVVDRRNFLRRTDNGVFSVYAMQLLNDYSRHKVVAGRVTSARYQEGSKNIELTINHEDCDQTKSYDRVVFATGFDQLGFLKNLFSGRARELIESWNEPEATANIDDDLSLKGFDPPLHLPMLSAVAQGPGFANLSCLGLLSDRIMIPQLTMRLVNSTEFAKVSELRRREYSSATGFTVSLDTLNWTEADDQSYVLGIMHGDNIVATMRGEIIECKFMLEKKLEYPWPLPFSGKVLLLSRAATSDKYRTNGLNLAMREWFIRFADYHGIDMVAGTFVAGSAREKTLLKMGYQFFENKDGWLQSTYRSYKPVIIAVLDMKKNGLRAIEYAKQKATPMKSLTDFPEVRMVSTL